MQAPEEWPVRGFEEEMDRVKALPDVVAFAIELAEGTVTGRAIGHTTVHDRGGTDLRSQSAIVRFGAVCEGVLRSARIIGRVWSVTNRPCAMSCASASRGRNRRGSGLASSSA